MSEDYVSVILTIDAGKHPDWDAARRFLADVEIPDEYVQEFQGFPAEDGTPVEQARQALREALDRIAIAEELAREDRAYNYQIRTVRGTVDIHILYDDPHDPVDLWNDEAILDDYAEGVFVAAGFDS